MELPPDSAIEVEESTPNHWVGSCGDVVMIFAYEGSSEDATHVHAASRVIGRLSRKLGRPVNFLFVLPPRHSRAPQKHVRDAIIQAAKKHEASVRRASVVVAGEGFGAAVHRGVVTGIFALFSTKNVTVERQVADGLAHLMPKSSESFAPVLSHCEACMAVHRMA